MHSHKTSEIRGKDAPGNKRKKIRLLSRFAFWFSMLVLALLVAFKSWRSAGSMPLEGTRSAETGGGHVRRETKNGLSPALFVGKTALAYQLAQEIPEVLDQLYCYCHCDKSIGHVSLLSCFTDTHAANCGVCQNEAFDAAAMLKKGSSLPEIKRQIDQKYGRA